MKEGLIEELKAQEHFIMNTIECLSEVDSAFAPKEGMLTVAQHLGHIADTIPWFMDGAFGPAGFDMNFENYGEKLKQYTSYDKCVEMLKQNYATAKAKINELPTEELMKPITGQIMKGAPRMAAIYGIGDHTAHHRGSLAVYARLLGKTPKVPYADM